MEGVEPKMRGVKTNLLILTFVAVLLALGAWTVQTKLAGNARAEVARSLTIVRDTTHLAVKTWYKSQKAAAAVWADAPKIRESTARLLALPPHQSALLGSPVQQELRDWFRPIRNATRYQGYFIVGPNQINLASSRDQNVGVENLLVGQKGFLSDAWAGRPAVSLPTGSDVPLSDSHGRLVSGLPSIFVAAPIRGEDTGKVIAIFMFRLDPEQGFTNTLKQGRIGKTGETYAFDGKGRLISQSRFDDQLHESGLISEGERGILNIQLRDPGVNLIEGEKAIEPRSQLPLTHMAKSAIQGKTGIDLDGHRDYRGVPVVGAWTWDPELGLGVATELDMQEAYQTLRATRWTIVTLTVFVFFLLVALTVIYTLFQQRRMAEEELRRAATVFDNTDEAIIVSNAEANIILVNSAFTVITGYKPEDVLGKNPRLLQSGRHDAAFYQTMWDILNRDGQWRGEIWNRRKNGDIYPAWENINVVKDGHGRLTNYVAIFSDISVLKESEERMAELAHHDTLTGLPNRLRFVANLEQAIKSAKRHKHKVALMFLDLDRFKYINDTLGHNVGDELLKTISGRLKSCVRAEDTVARLGGDEFTVVLREVTHAEDAGLIADKIVKVVRKPVTVSGEIIDTSASVGISIFPDDAVECEGMLKAADTAMYHAKAMGKNSFQYFSADLVSRTFEHARIEK
jgi:diguanylate cyclase (GGDEF)-like protein/PAS domain S-box-containing protein